MWSGVPLANAVDSATLAWDALSPAGKVENLMKVADLAAYRAARDMAAIR